jgi:hypothetical protein
VPGAIGLELYRRLPGPCARMKRYGLGGLYLKVPCTCNVYGAGELVDVELRSALMGIVMCACGTDVELVARNGLYIKVARYCDLVA